MDQQWTNTFIPQANAQETLSLSALNPNSAGISINGNAGLLLRNVITLVIVVSAVMTLYHMMMGAMLWISSAGDKGKVAQARDRILAAIVGILILASTWAVFQLTVTVAFGTNFTQMRIPTLVDGWISK